MYQKIKKLCKERNISIYYLEKQLELSTGSICKWEKSTPRADTIFKVANYFGVSIEYLLESSSYKDKEKGSVN